MRAAEGRGRCALRRDPTPAGRDLPYHRPGEGPAPVARRRVPPQRGPVATVRSCPDSGGSGGRGLRRRGGEGSLPSAARAGWVRGRDSPYRQRPRPPWGAAGTTDPPLWGILGGFFPPVPSPQGKTTKPDRPLTGCAFRVPGDPPGTLPRSVKRCSPVCPHGPAPPSRQPTPGWAAVSGAPALRQPRGAASGAAVSGGSPPCLPAAGRLREREREGVAGTREGSLEAKRVSCQQRSLKLVSLTVRCVG